MPEKSRSDTNRYVWSRSVPDPGQLVEIRRRQWVVGDVEASAFSSTGNGKQHLVTLAALDEDSLAPLRVGLKKRSAPSCGPLAHRT